MSETEWDETDDMPRIRFGTQGEALMDAQAKQDEWARKADADRIADEEADWDLRQKWER